MKKTVTAAVVAAFLLGGTTALAVKKGETLYVKAKSATAFDKPGPKGKAQKPKLEFGDAVTWEGADKTDPTFHSVSGKVKGVVHQSVLATKKPTGEVTTSDGAPMSPQAFASSGAATKALTAAGIKYASAKGPDAQAAAAQVIYVEEHTKASGTFDAAAKHTKAQGLTAPVKENWEVKK